MTFLSSMMKLHTRVRYSVRYVETYGNCGVEGPREQMEKSNFVAMDWPRKLL